MSTTEFPCGATKMFWTRQSWWLYNITNVLNANKLFLKRLILCSVNPTLIKNMIRADPTSPQRSACEHFWTSRSSHRRRDRAGSKHHGFPLSPYLQRVCPLAGAPADRLTLNLLEPTHHCPTQC